VAPPSVVRRIVPLSPARYPVVGSTKWIPLVAAAMSPVAVDTPLFCCVQVVPPSAVTLKTPALAPYQPFVALAKKIAVDGLGRAR